MNHCRNQDLNKLNKDIKDKNPERDAHKLTTHELKKDHKRYELKNKDHNQRIDEQELKDKDHNQRIDEQELKDKDHNQRIDEQELNDKDCSEQATDPESETKDHCRQSSMERPFAHLRLAPSDFLDSTARSACPHCGRSRRFYCPVCCVPVPPGQPLPVVRLPFTICVLKHPAEYHGKSTSPHAALLSPDCRLVRYPLLPELPDRSSVVLVYPAGQEAISVDDLVRRMAGVGAGGLDDSEQFAGRSQEALEGRMRKWTVLFVDSTWRQANAIVNDDRLLGIPRVALSNHSSRYWRYEEGLTPKHLSTIEAIYYLCTDVHTALCQLGYYKDSCGGVYDGRYDNLLLYFNHLYSILYTCYEGGRACDTRKRRHFHFDREGE